MGGVWAVDADGSGLLPRLNRRDMAVFEVSGGGSFDDDLAAAVDAIDTTHLR